MALKIYKLESNGRLIRLRKDAFPQHLSSAWQSKLSLLRGNPNTARTAQFGPFEVRYCPWRASRPLPPLETDANIREPHRPCVFDRKEAINNEGVAALDVNGRRYYVLVNINPVRHNHWLVTRAPDENSAALSQIIHNPTDVTDLAEMQGVFPPEIAFLFNSNPGGGSNSGASQNHFHVHAFEFGEAVREAALQTLPEFRDLEAVGIMAGQIPEWPSSSRVFQGTNYHALGREVFLYAEVLTDAGQAHNLVFYRYPGGLERVVVIPRTLGIPITPFKGRSPVDRLAGAHVGNLGSFTDEATFDLMLEDPAGAKRVLFQHLRETTVDQARLAVFDRAYFAARPDVEARMKNEGLDFVLRLLPQGFLNRLLSIKLNMDKSSNPDLISRSAGAQTVTVFDVFERLDITGHMLEVYKSLRLFRNARDLHQRGELEKRLRGKGNPASVTKEGLIPSIPVILELSGIINRLLENPEIEAAFYAAIFLHDIGKFTSQTMHGENSFTLLRNNTEIAQVLAEAFSPEQVVLIQNLARHHSLYTDTMVVKEPDILRPYRAVLENPREEQPLINDLLYVMGIIDTDAYFPGLSRLSNDRLADLQDLHIRIRQALAQGKSIQELEARADEILCSWGKTRFRSWVTGETDLKEGRAEASIATAESELARIFPQPEEREKFYLLLGRAKHVGLIFDLRKELLDPESRTRLLVWFSRKVEEYGAVPYEFRIYRKKGRWVGPEVKLMRGLLARTLYIERLDETLLLEVQPNGAVEIVIPT